MAHSPAMQLSRPCRIDATACVVRRLFLSLLWSTENHEKHFQKWTAKSDTKPHRHFRVTMLYHEQGFFVHESSPFPQPNFSAVPEGRNLTDASFLDGL